MLCVSPFCESDFSAVLDQHKWIADLDGTLPGHELLLVGSSGMTNDQISQVNAIARKVFSKVSAIRQSGPDPKRWPQGPNAMFLTALEFIKQKNHVPFLWLEPDHIPLVPGWLNQIETDYKSRGIPFYGVMWDKPFRHLNGSCVYPANLESYNPYIRGASELPFDCVRPEMTLRHAYNSPLMQRSLADPSRNLPHSFPNHESLRVIRSGVVLFHGSKSGDLIARLREQRGCPVQSESAPASTRFVLPWNRRKTVNKLLHVFTLYHPKDPETVRRNEIAQRTWPCQDWLPFPIKDSDLPRLWTEAGRSFPFIKDMFDLACADASKNDVVVYTNADICLSTDCSKRVREAMMGTDAVYCYRRDFKHLGSPLPDSEIVKGHDYCGSDLKAFRVGWWRKHRKDFPDMILGMELWDPCLRILMDQTNPAGKCRLQNLIYHQRHDSYWERPENRYSLKAQRHCLKAGANYLRKLGQDVTESGVPMWYGLEADLVVLGLAHESVMFNKLIPNLEATLSGLTWKAFVCAKREAQPVLRQWLNRRPQQVMPVDEPVNLDRLRYRKMAQLRNAVLRKYRESGLEAKAILWMDMDTWGFWNCSKAIKTLLNGNSWDAVAAYGLMPKQICRNDVPVEPVIIENKPYVYYDWLAWEQVLNRRVLWHSNGEPHWYSHGKVPEDTVFITGAPAHVTGRVNSAFGPACFYRPEAIDGLVYDEQGDQCEHQGFHAQMRAKGRDKLFVSQDIVALYEK